MLYQVTWQRMLALFSGADVYAATVIVAAFMAGLGLGHLAGGYVADGVTRRTSLVLFGVAEAAIALFGLLSTALYYGFLYQRLGQVAIGSQMLPVILFVSLLWPTFFMGASLPLLARAMTLTVGQASRSIGALYGANTLGAALGAAVATWGLLPYLGLEGSLRVGVVLNLACAIAAWPIARRLQFTTVALPDSTPYAAVVTSMPSANEEPQLPTWFWAVSYGVAGFIALSLEIVWFRLLGVMVKSTAFTFGTLLALYLIGLGLGAAIGSTLAPRSRRPALAFFGLQAAGGISAAVLLIALISVVDYTGPLVRYFAGYEPLGVADSVGALTSVVSNFLNGRDQTTTVPRLFLALYLGLPLLLVVPTTLLIGCAFPFLQSVVHTDARRIGRRVGLLLTANIIGSALGTVVTGMFLLRWLGTAGTLQLLVALSGIWLLLSLLARVWRPRPAVVGATVLAFVLLVLTMPGGSHLWAALHGTTPVGILFSEDDTGLAAIKKDAGGFEAGAVVFVNGLGQSTIPYGGIHTALGALPVFVHPEPKHAFVIGLGSGDTLYAVAGNPHIERVTSLEIVRPQLQTLRDLDRRFFHGGLRALLEDSRLDHVSGDGRAFLMRTGRKFDVIEADALRPTSAYAGNLYSEEYFRLLRDHLNPNGLAATWEPPTSRVRATFVRAFPYVLSLPEILLGSNDPIRFDRVQISARLADPLVREYYRRARIDIEDVLLPYLMTEPVRYGPAFDRSGLTDFNTDLFPRDEYGLLRPKS